MLVRFLGALTLLFIGLRLTGFIDWPWWQVMAPAMVGVAILATWVVLVARRMTEKETRR